eukprot:g6611.t1
MSTAGASSKPGKRLVSAVERRGFVEAVLAGKLDPDLSAVAYHFEGWLDKDVVDAVFEVSSGPIEAVSALAGMFPPEAEAAPTNNSGIGSSNRSSCTGGEEGADQPAASTVKESAAATAAAVAAADAVLRANKRHARTLEDIQAQRRPTASPTEVALATPAAEEEKAGSPVAEAEPEVEVDPSAGRVDGSSGSSNAELEKVAAFIASYAGEQEAAPAASRAPTKPPEPPFLVPRGVSVPSTTKVQLAIGKTAEKAVELPGFEAFMKMQHGTDNLFRFLAAEHALHSYYLVAKKHVQETVMKGGKAKNACAADPRKGPPATNGKTEDPDVAEIMRMLGGVGP